MADTFKASVKLQTTDNDGTWVTWEHMAAFVERILRDHPGRLEIEYTARDEEQSAVSRSDPQGLKDAIRENHLVAENVLAELVYFKPGNVSSFFGDLQVRTWGLFAPGIVSHRVDVDIESGDRLLLEGVKSRVTAERDVLDSANTTPVSEVLHEGVVPGFEQVYAIRHLGSTETSPEPTPAGPAAPESARDWIRRTWRDHTAAFTIAVSGTILGGAFLLWLGITQ